MPELPKTKIPLNAQKEAEEKDLLKKILSKNVKFIPNPDFDSTPDIDGRLYLLEDDLETKTGKVLDVSIKSVLGYHKNGVPYTQVKLGFFGVCQNSNVPILLVAVDAEKQAAFWEYIGPEFVSHKFSTKPAAASPQVNVAKKVAQDKNNDYVKDWGNVCDYHNNKFSDKLIEILLKHQKENFCRHDFDSILEKLKILKDLILFRSGVDYPVADFLFSLGDKILKNQCGYQAVKKTSFGEIPSSDSKDLKEEYLEAITNPDLKNFLEFDEVFNMLISFFENDSEVKDKTQKALEDLVEYNLNVLTLTGYSNQINALRIISQWSKEQKNQNIELIKLTATKLLEPSFRGTKMVEWNKMVISHGPLNPTPALIKIRQDAIDLIIEIYQAITDVKAKLGLIEILNHASFHPHDYNPDFQAGIDEMINGNIRCLVKFYDGLAAKENIVILHEIEDQLNWFNKNHKAEVPEIDQLLAKLSKNEFYTLYSFLVTKDYYYTADQPVIAEKIDKLVDGINDGNHQQWVENMEKIAETKKYKDGGGDWEFSRFRQLLGKIGKNKPDFAKILLQNALLKNQFTTSFLNEILYGLRLAGKHDIIDWLTKEVIEKKQFELLKYIAASMLNVESLRQEDADFLIKTVKQEEEFSFIKDFKAQDSFYHLRQWTMKALAMSACYKIKPEDCKEAIKLLIAEDEKSINNFVWSLELADHTQNIKLADWPKEDFKPIISQLLKVDQLQHEYQQVLLKYGHKDFEGLIEFFIKRIGIRTIKERSKKLTDFSRYEAIPYHFNHELTDFIKSHPDYIKEIKKHVANMTPKWSHYNWDLSHFIQRVGGPTIDQTSLEIIKEGDFKSLGKAMDIIGAGEGIDISLCFEVVKNIDGSKVTEEEREKIEREAIGLMFHTGVVSGEHGISNAYQRKLEEIKKINAEGMPELEKFKSRAIEAFESSIKKQREDENKELEELKKQFKEE